MKRLLQVKLAVLIGLLFVTPCFADKATREEAVAKVRAAAEMIRTEGLEATLAKIGDKTGPFTWKNSYVFCMRAKTGEMLAHPYIAKRFMGLNVNDAKDATGKEYVREMLAVVEKDGEGWVTHERSLQRKNVYVLQVPGTDVIVGGGYTDGGTYPAPVFTISDRPVPATTGKKIAVVIAPARFEDNEYQVPMALFAKAGASTTVYSKTTGLLRGMYGSRVQVDHKLEDLDVAQFDAVVFVGGGGVEIYHDNPLAHAIARNAAAQNKLLAAICWAPVILAKAGLLEGREVTVNPVENDWFKHQGLHCSGKTVSVDGNIITANGPAASDEFGRAILAALR